MLKKKLIKRIMILVCCLFIIGILYVFPSSTSTEEDVDFIRKEDQDIIYLIDENNFVARVNVVLENKDDLKKAREIIELLTINSSKEDYIRDGFHPIIPQNTKIIDLSLDNKILKINFTKEFLNVSKDDEQKLIESLIYSLTELESIDSITIFVEGNILDELPNSKMNLSPTLDRKFGINKIYNLNSIDNSSKTTIYYISKYEDFYYYVPVTKVNNSEQEKIEIIIKELSSSTMYQTNLMSYLTSNTELINYSVLSDSIVLNFNNNILADINSNEILEEVVYSINLSISDNYDIKSVMYLVEDNIINNYVLN